MTKQHNSNMKLRPLLFSCTALTLALTAGVADAGNNRKDIPRWKRKYIPKLYSIQLGKKWDDITESQPSNVDFAARTRRPKTCGDDTFLTISSDYKVEYAYEGAYDYLARFTAVEVTSQLATKFYPGGELREVTPPERVIFAGEKPAWFGTYRIIFNNGKRYAMRYYLTFQSGYAVHVIGYSLGQDVLRAEPCFEKLLKNLTFNNLKPA
jgi:hypothetical protein